MPRGVPFRSGDRMLDGPDHDRVQTQSLTRAKGLVALGVSMCDLILPGHIKCVEAPRSDLAHIVIQCAGLHTKVDRLTF